ncbi:hypothetical protein HF668_01670 [Acidithiobacillus ferridurans]|uniref:hypothetical protein n=1 Tax=Acidithiobacillus ferridurans TaxID=1232575 RepID=UPI001C078BC0|nr:hypothetical protein [Acidithiobacillus ferridurans]MBU2803891.1 hypothetical protein [Acidithiobacillus ferridurans]
MDGGQILSSLTGLRCRIGDFIRHLLWSARLDLLLIQRLQRTRTDTPARLGDRPFTDDALR